MNSWFIDLLIAHVSIDEITFGRSNGDPERFRIIMKGSTMTDTDTICSTVVRDDISFIEMISNDKLQMIADDMFNKLVDQFNRKEDFDGSRTS